jgi:hypothetical protein
MDAPWDFVGMLVWVGLMPYLVGIAALALVLVAVLGHYGLQWAMTRARGTLFEAGIFSAERMSDKYSPQAADATCISSRPAWYALIRRRGP